MKQIFDNGYIEVKTADIGSAAVYCEDGEVRPCTVTDVVSCSKCASLDAYNAICDKMDMSASDIQWEFVEDDDIIRVNLATNPIVATQSMYPDGFDDVFVFLPESKSYISVQEGTGDNLLADDIADGYVDYVMYSLWHRDNSELVEDEGGMIMMRELIRDKYERLADLVPEVLADAGLGGEAYVFC